MEDIPEEAKMENGTEGEITDQSRPVEPRGNRGIATEVNNVPLEKKKPFDYEGINAAPFYGFEVDDELQYPEGYVDDGYFVLQEEEPEEELMKRVPKEWLEYDRLDSMGVNFDRAAYCVDWVKPNGGESDELNTAARIGFKEIPEGNQNGIEEEDDDDDDEEYGELHFEDEVQREEMADNEVEVDEFIPNNEDANEEVDVDEYVPNQIEEEIVDEYVADEYVPNTNTANRDTSGSRRPENALTSLDYLTSPHPSLPDLVSPFTIGEVSPGLSPVPQETDSTFSSSVVPSMSGISPLGENSLALSGMNSIDEEGFSFTPREGEENHFPSTPREIGDEVDLPATPKEEDEESYTLQSLVSVAVIPPPAEQEGPETEEMTPLLEEKTSGSLSFQKLDEAVVVGDTLTEGGEILQVSELESAASNEVQREPVVSPTPIRTVSPALVSSVNRQHETPLSPAPTQQESPTPTQHEAPLSPTPTQQESPRSPAPVQPVSPALVSSLPNQIGSPLSPALIQSEVPVSHHASDTPSSETEPIPLSPYREMASADNSVDLTPSSLTTRTENEEGTGLSPPRSSQEKSSQESFTPNLTHSSEEESASTVGPKTPLGSTPLFSPDASMTPETAPSPSLSPASLPLANMASVSSDKHTSVRPSSASKVRRPQPTPRRPRASPQRSSASVTSEPISANSLNDDNLPGYLRQTKSRENKLRRTEFSAKGAATPPKKETYRPTLTHAKTPHFSQRPKRNQLPPSDQLELEKAQRQLQLEREAQERKKRAVLSAVPAHVEKKPLTKPESPSFVAPKRPHAVRKTELQEKQKEDGEKERMLRQNLISSSHGPVKATHPAPFSFVSDKRLKQTEQHGEKREEYVPLAVRAQSFQTKTPARYRTKQLELPERKEMHLTQPTAPHFVTDTRLRPPTDLLTAVQKEDIDLKKFRPFKAKPVNRRILESAGDLGVPKVEKKAPCVSKPFLSHTQYRAETRKPVNVASDEAGEKESVDAKPKRAMMGLIKRPRANSNTSQNRHLRPTEAKPFSFATDARAAARPPTPPRDTRSDEGHVKMHARGMPDFSRPPKLPVVERREPVRPQPFQLESDRRHEIAKARLEQQLKEQQEKEARERQFKARPIMVPRDPPSPLSSAMSERPLTDPVTPFVLKRSEMSKAEFERRLKEQNENDAAMHNFKARPVPHTTYEKDFSPERSFQITGVLDVKLETEERASARAEFDNHMREKLSLQEEERLIQDRIRREEEERNLREYRASLVRKANPVPDYNTLNPPRAPPSPKELTHAESPFLVTKQRLGPKSKVGN